MQLNFTGTNSLFFPEAFFNDQGLLDDVDIVSNTSTQLVLQNTATGMVTNFTGSGFVVVDGNPVQGTINSMSFTQNGIPQGSLTGIAWNGLAFVQSLLALEEDETYQPLVDLINGAGPIVADASNALGPMDLEALFEDFSSLITQPITYEASPFGGRFQGGMGNDRANLVGDDGYSFVDSTPGNDTVDFSGVSGARFTDVHFDDWTSPVTLNVDGAANTGSVSVSNSTTTFIDVFSAMSADGLGLSGGTGDDTLTINNPEGGWFYINGLEGNDTYNLSLEWGGRVSFRWGKDQSPTDGLVVDLGTGVVSNDGHGFTDQINRISGTAQIEIEGTDNNDTVTGSDFNDGFISQRGDDVFDAGEGIDRIRYDRSGVDSVSVDLSAETATAVWTGEAFTDTLISVERVRGSRDGDDVIIGSDANYNEIDTYNGDDSVEGLGGYDEIQTREGNDTLRAGTGDGLLDGGNGDDTYSVDGRDDSFVEIEDSSGFDTLELLDYQGTDASTFVNLGTEVIRTTNYGSQTAFAIENGAPIIEQVRWVGISDDGSRGYENTAVLEIDPNAVGNRLDILFAGTDGADAVVMPSLDASTTTSDFGMVFLNGGDDDLTLSSSFLYYAVAGDGNDTIRGVGGIDDYIRGDAGDDVMIGADGNDTMLGGEGNDQVVMDVDIADITLTEVSPTRYTVVSSEGTDTLIDVETLVLNDGTLSLVNRGEEITGSDADEVLPGGERNDTIIAGRGDDIVEAGAGDDDVRGDGGFDVLNGGDGDDTIRGGREEDTINGDAGNDVLRGQKSSDIMTGGDGDDNIKGGGGNDFIYGGAGNDFLKGGTRADVVEGDAGNDKLFGNGFNDTLNGGDGNDIVNGGGNDDRLSGGAGNDFVKGGSGADVFIFNEGFELDRIADFTLADDRLEISAQLAAGRDASFLANLEAEVTSQGVEIDFGNGDIMVLLGLTDTTGLETAIDII